jgi:23S rRNA (uridine2479-2'-O)-methyltransferase
VKITARNAAFQQWQALLANRTKRQRAGEFLVQGVRPITLAIDHGWPIRDMIYDMDRPLSRWATDALALPGVRQVAMAPELLAELGEKEGGAPELVAVAEIPPDDFTRIPHAPDLLTVAFDRPTSPGNVGTLVRSADAFGARGVIVTGHAADPYDPKSVRASTGSLFAVPVVRAAGPAEVSGWARTAGLTIVGTDEKGDADIADTALTGPTMIVIGNETTGLSTAWREACDVIARIPIAGAASSLNAANAAAIVLYEAARQRRPRLAGEAGSGAPAEGRHETVPVAGTGSEHDVAGLDILERDRGQVRAQAMRVAVAGDGHGPSGGDEFQLVLDAVKGRAVGCRAAVGAGVNAPVGIQDRVGAAHVRHGFVGDVIEPDRFLAGQPVAERHHQHPRLIVEGCHVEAVGGERQPDDRGIDPMVEQRRARFVRGLEQGLHVGVGVAVA